MATYPFEENHDTVCYCMNVDNFTIKKAIYDLKLKEVDDVIRETKAGGGCMSCHMTIEAILDEVWEQLEKEGFKRY